MSRLTPMVTVGALVDAGSILAIQDGNHGGSHPKSSEYVPDGIPFVMASDIADGRLALESCKRLPKERTDRLRIGFAKSGDVLLTHKGTVGGVALVPNVADYAMLTPQVTYYRVDPNKLNPQYLKFAFRSPGFQAQLANVSAQSTRPYVAISTQRFLSIPVPPLDTQRRIASILGAYDDLIEVNRRRVAGLEEMARGLFEEWFVRFRFPGHEGVAMVEAADGVLPEGWQRVAFSKLAQFTNGFAFKPSDFQAEGLPIVKIPELKNGVSSKTPRNSGIDVPERLHLRNGDLLFSWSGTLAVSEWTGGDSLLNQHLFKVVPEGPLGRGFLKQALLAAMPVFENQGVGATMKHIRRSALDQTAVAVPSDDSLNALADERFSNMYDQVVVLRRQNQILSAARDFLLPRLISGQLSIEVAERELEEAA